MPTKEECFDQFELIAREFVYCFEDPEDLREDVTPSRRAS